LEPSKAARRPHPPAVRQAIAAAGRGLEIMGAPMALWLVQQFMHDAQFRARMAHPPVRISRHDWLIFPPKLWISWPPGEPARLTIIPPLRVDPRYGLRPPPVKLGRPHKRSSGAQLRVASNDPEFDDRLFLNILMVIAQAMVDAGQRLKVVLRDFAGELTPKSTPHQRAMIEVQLRRAWWRHRKAQQKAVSQLSHGVRNSCTTFLADSAHGAAAL
jgi:hypothetical protein